MERLILFGLGALARALSALLAFYSDWLFNRLLDGVDGTLDLAHDLWEFTCALVTALTERLTGGPRREVRRHGDEWEPELFGR